MITPMKGVKRKLEELITCENNNYDLIDNDDFHKLMF